VIVGTRADTFAPIFALKVLGSIVSASGRKNLRQTASALQAWLERPAD
jgi:hypothetical protein